MKIRSASKARTAGKIRSPLWIVFTGIALFMGAAVWLGRGPDLEVSFKREIPLKTQAADVGLALRAVINWPRWIFSLKDAQVVGPDGQPLPPAQQEARVGARVKMWIEPKKREWKRYELLTEVTRASAEGLTLRVLSDSKQKLTTAFTDLEWNVDVVHSPASVRGKPFGDVKLVGSSRAQTAHWRSRLFGRLAPNILMYQAFYPDLMTLAQLKQPLPLNPPEEVLQRFRRQQAEAEAAQGPQPY